MRTGETATFFKLLDRTLKPLSGDDAQRLARSEMSREIFQATLADAHKGAVASAKFEGEYERIVGAAAADPAAATAPKGPDASVK